MPRVLIIHGFPQRFSKDHILYSFFKPRGYDITAPSLFSGFTFKLENCIGHLIKSLHGNTPDVIVGLSLGGLIAPHIAEKYPGSKLVLVGTGTRFSPPSKLVKLIVTHRKISLILFSIIKICPKSLLYFLYKSINPHITDALGTPTYHKDMEKNIVSLTQISNSKLNQILSFITTIDNQDICSRLSNPTLILGAQYDNMIGKSESILLSQKIINSKVDVIEADHFNVLSLDSLRIIDAFL
ncbi:MAG: alpha/beta hydrolase [Candidatus Woesearchaeota archaeon]